VDEATELTSKDLDNAVPYHAVETGVEDTKALIGQESKPVMSTTDALRGMSDTYGQWKSNNGLAGADAVKAINRLAGQAIMTVRDNPGLKRHVMLQAHKMVDQIRKHDAELKFMAILGAGGLFAALSPAEAEAAISAPAFKILEEGIKKGYIATTKVTDNTFVVLKDQFQKGIPGKELAQHIKDNARDVMSKAVGNKLRGLAHGMSPYQVLQHSMGVGHKKMFNAAVMRLSYTTAEKHNINMASKVINNIFRESGISPAFRDVRKRFKPLARQMEDVMDYSFTKDTIKGLRKELDKTIPKRKYKDPVDKAHDIEIAEQELEYHRRRLDEMELSDETVKTFHKDWAQVAAKAAREIPSVRISLTLGDDAAHTKYPFMKDIPLSHQEKVVAGRLKDQLLQYRGRLEELGEDVIKDNYFPHVFNPDVSMRRLTRRLGDDRVPAHLRFYRRSFDSRPLMPDAHYSMMRYIVDTERRIGQISFWKKDGWNDVLKVAEDRAPIIADALKVLKDGTKPHDQTLSNDIANYYSRIEVVKRLFLSPSAGLKHLFKMTADLTSAGKHSAPAMGPAFKMTLRRFLRTSPKTDEMFKEMGVVSTSRQNKILDSYMDSLVYARTARSRLIDMNMTAPEHAFTGIKEILHKVENAGGVFINMAELFDRGLSLTTGINMAAKQGMTVEQAMYGAYDLILKNNFMGREFNPRWARNPKARAMLLFQSTPFKILERRVVNALRTGRSLKVAWKEGHKVYDTKGVRGLAKDLRNIRRYVKEGENYTRASMIMRGLETETDFYGNSAAYLFLKDLLFIGATTYGGASAGMNLHHHIFHIPFVRDNRPNQLALAPGIQAIDRGWQAYKKREEFDQDFLHTKIIQGTLHSMRAWAGPAPLLPDTFWKVQRLTQDDIPDIYDNSELKYLFAIPAAGKH
jgi:hypothetical protein